FLYCTAAVSFCGNGLLLLLLLHRSGAALGNYRILLAAFAITDVCISLYHTWFIPMFVLGKYGFIYYGHGSIFSKKLMSKYSNEIFSTTFYLPFFLIGIHFIYRYLSLARPSYVKEKFIGFSIFCAVYALVYNTFFALLSHAVCELGISKRFYVYLSEFERRPLTPDVNAAVVEYLDENNEINFRAIFIILSAGAVGGHSIVISLICIFNIFRALNNKVLEISVKRGHIQLFRALLLQFSIPFVFSFLPFAAIVSLPATGISLGLTGDV
ncbi:hypothetical protein PENTCL1PPCAC_15556, partial [Pristionchus entomophagus]